MEGQPPTGDIYDPSIDPRASGFDASQNYERTRPLSDSNNTSDHQSYSRGGERGVRGNRSGGGGGRNSQQHYRGRQNNHQTYNQNQQRGNHQNDNRNTNRNTKGREGQILLIEVDAPLTLEELQNMNPKLLEWNPWQVSPGSSSSPDSYIMRFYSFDDKSKFSTMKVKDSKSPATYYLGFKTKPSHKTPTIDQTIPTKIPYYNESSYIHNVNGLIRQCAGPLYNEVKNLSENQQKPQSIRLLWKVGFHSFINIEKHQISMTLKDVLMSYKSMDLLPRFEPMIEQRYMEFVENNMNNFNDPFILVKQGKELYQIGIRDERTGKSYTILIRKSPDGAGFQLKKAQTFYSKKFIADVIVCPFPRTDPEIGDPDTLLVQPPHLPGLRLLLEHGDILNEDSPEMKNIREYVNEITISPSGNVNGPVGRFTMSLVKRKVKNCYLSSSGNIKVRLSHVEQTGTCLDKTSKLELDITFPKWTSEFKKARQSSVEPNTSSYWDPSIIAESMLNNFEAAHFIMTGRVNRTISDPIEYTRIQIAEWNEKLSRIKNRDIYELERRKEESRCKEMELKEKLNSNGFYAMYRYEPDNEPSQY